MQGPARQLAAGTSCLAPYGDASLAGDPQEGDDLVSRGTLAEVTVVLRWERLVGRLAAAAAQRKTLLLLQWLQLHLAFTEGCGSRATWLSHKVGGHHSVRRMPCCSHLTHGASRIR